MAAPFFKFKQFTIHHDRCAMKVTTDACLFGAWCAEQLKGQTGTALDIGAGTGLVSLLIAQKCKLRIDAVEIDPQAVLQASENLDAAGFEGISILAGDIRSLDLPSYPIIVSNPPFYENEIESDAAGKRLAHHSDGLPWKDLFEVLDRLLTVDGTVFLLVPAKRRKDLDRYLLIHKLFVNKLVEVYPTEKALASRIMLQISRRPMPYETEKLQIANSSGYTEHFVELLRDYYLYL